MTILFGHPTGNPNSFHAALAHFNAGRLDAFCVPWMPSLTVKNHLELLGPLLPAARRFARRHFAPLSDAAKVQGRTVELARLLQRILGCEQERLAYEANDWLMRTMARECRRPTINAIHAYEDCSLWQFAEAKRLGKACIYDMPIGYYPAWEHVEAELARRYSDWIPEGGLASRRYVRPEQKRQEMALADLVLVPSTFVEGTIRAFHPKKAIARAAYGVDLDFWQPGASNDACRPMRFIFVGQVSLRKGIPNLLEAWEKAAIADAELELVGAWHLAGGKRSSLPNNVTWFGPQSPSALREHYQAADVLVFPSFFEGLGLVLLEGMACGVPVIASEATGGADFLDATCGRVIPTGNLEALIEALRWFAKHRERVSAMRCCARTRAQQYTWENYRHCVDDAVASFC